MSDLTDHEELHRLQSEASSFDPGPSAGPDPVEGEYLPADTPPQADPQTVAMIYMMLRSAFGILAPAWGVSDEECDQLAQAWGLPVDKLLEMLPGADNVENAGPWIAAIMATSMIVGPRVAQGMPRRHPPEPEQKREAGPTDETPPPAGEGKPRGKAEPDVSKPGTIQL